MNPSSTHFALVSTRVVTADGLRPAAVYVKNGTISAVVAHDDVPANVPADDLGDLIIAPGIIDSHVHVNEPGRTEWEGIESATRAAAAGGVTTLVDMPLNSDPVTTSVAALQAKRTATVDKCWIDVGFHGGLAGGNVADIEPLIDAGVCGIKCFLCHSGLDEFPAVTEAELRAALPILARRGSPLLVHAELVEVANAPPASIRSHQQWAALRPKRFEVAAVEWMIELATEYRAPIHIVHLSSAEAVTRIAAAQRAGVPLSGETCPHYLFFCGEEIAQADPRFKCAPPIGLQQDRDALWQALIEGTIATIGSDHSPAPPDMKFLDERDFLRAWGGISSLQLTLPIVWTAARQRGIPLERLSDWLAAAPARLVGMAHRKGRIAPGFDADLVVWNPEQRWTVDETHLQHRHKLTPYHGANLWGKVQRTYVRGRLAFDEGRFADAPSGQFLCRAPSPCDVHGGLSVRLANHLNQLSADACRAALKRCCAARVWIEAMMVARPFASDVEVLQAAHRCCDVLEQSDWLEAFAAHPRIGDVESLRARFADTRAWASSEQAGVQDASDETLRRLAEANDLYYHRFGFIFIVCATGKSVGEMLALLEARLKNDPADEWRVAADEQRKITELRLKKLPAGEKYHG